MGTSEHQPPTHAWSACLPAPASDAPVHGSVGANGDASENLWLKSPQKDGQSTNQLRWPARSGAGLLPAPKGLEERFRQWTRRSSPLNPAQGLFHLLAGEDVPLGQPFESGQDYDVLDWSQA